MGVNVQKKILPWVDSSNVIEPTAVVLHWWHTPLWLGDMRYFVWRLKRRGLSVQFAVLANGEIYQLVKDPTVLCHHARCANSSSIGIEIQGFGKHDLDGHPNQFQSVVKLVTDLCNKYSIPTDFSVETELELKFYGITSHKIVDRYCSPRLIKKRDVHDDYVRRVAQVVKLNAQ